MALKNVFETEIPNRLKAKPELAKEINANVHFNITGDGGGTWTLDCTKTENWASVGAVGEPKMVVTCAAADFEKIVAKQLNPNMAAMQQKLKFKPFDMTLAMKLGKLLA